MEFTDDPDDSLHLQAIMYLDSRRHGLAFALSYLHWQPAAPLPQQHPGSAYYLPATTGPPKAPILPPTRAFRQAISHFKWATIVALTQVKCTL